MEYRRQLGCAEAAPFVFSSSQKEEVSVSQNFLKVTPEYPICLAVDGESYNCSIFQILNPLLLFRDILYLFLMLLL